MNDVPYAQKPITAQELQRWWFTYGPQPGEEDGMTRTIHVIDFLRLVLFAASSLGYRLENFKDAGGAP